MSITVTGTVQSADFGPGAWSLVTDKGEQYELHQPTPDKLLQAGQKVKVTGKIRDDVMTMAMIGPVLQVEKFESL